MRDIKFRAWIYDKGMLHQGVASLWAFFDTLDRATKYELMQYTGLNDKNGTPIYEGDIVRCKYEEWAGGTAPSVLPPYKVRDVDVVGEVVFGGKGAFCVYLPNVGTGIKTPLLNYIEGMGVAPEVNIEVIGNIYEHPHLLENKK